MTGRRFYGSHLPADRPARPALAANPKGPGRVAASMSGFGTEAANLPSDENPVSVTASDLENADGLGLTGKTALVLGGGGGLGSAIACTLAREGARVAVAGRSMAPLEAVVSAIRADNGKALALAWDLGDLGCIEDRIARVEAELGPVDILVNNTGGPPPSSAAGQPASIWQAQFQAMVLLGNRHHRPGAAVHATASLGPDHHIHLVRHGGADPEPCDLECAALTLLRVVEDPCRRGRA